MGIETKTSCHSSTSGNCFLLSSSFHLKIRKSWLKYNSKLIINKLTRYYDKFLCGKQYFFAILNIFPRRTYFSANFFADFVLKVYKLLLLPIACMHVSAVYDYCRCSYQAIIRARVWQNEGAFYFELILVQCSLNSV